MTPAEKETLYLLSISGMMESIREGMAMSPEQCSDRLDWEDPMAPGSAG